MSKEVTDKVEKEKMQGWLLLHFIKGVNMTVKNDRDRKIGYEVIIDYMKDHGLL